ncbi:MAG TPA: hypothetical protein VMV46_10240 [Thermoanaerobaculia bacterium]|nr:hypothetical protein [Thermoanaerobaculia bacterium]
MKTPRVAFTFGNIASSGDRAATARSPTASIPGLFLVPFGALALIATAAPRADAQIAGEPRDPAAISSALRAARDAPAPAYRLRVDCAGDRGVRSVEVFPSGVAIWDLRTQVALPEATRRALVRQLDEGGFAALEPRYGGKPEKDDRDGEPAAALRVVCRVELELETLRASSIQLADGEQSAALAELANALLDSVAPLAREGVRADSLEQGLQKLSSGELRPEGFELRFVELPRRDAEISGSILHVAHRTATRRTYAPGAELGSPASVDLEDGSFRALIGAIAAADLSSLPVNLWAEDQLELEVRVLGHGRSVYARPFSRLAPGTHGEAQQRFDRLIETLRALRARTP